MDTPVTPVRLPVRAPSCDGLSMPAEWEEHEACWMAWPCKESSWPKGLDVARNAFVPVVRAIARFEPVKLLTPPEAASETQALFKGEGERVEIIPARVFDSWTRDSGPTFVTDGRGNAAGVDWVFNDWGHVDRLEGYYDESMALDILARLSMRRYVAPFIVEGGAIHVDGQGTLLTTESVMFDPRRNAALSREDYEDLFAAYLGVSKVVWLKEGLEDDETNGHVDILACFARPGVIMVHDCTDPDDHNYRVSRDAIQRLEAATDASGNSFEIIRMPQPALRRENGWRMDLSYINFYMANGGIIMSSFDDPADEAACAIMCETFPDREVVQVPSLDIFRGGGGIHCITQQQPKGAPLPVF